jgi:hypothetical protein
LYNKQMFLRRVICLFLSLSNTSLQPVPWIQAWEIDRINDNRWDHWGKKTKPFRKMKSADLSKMVTDTKPIRGKTLIEV